MEITIDHRDGAGVVNLAGILTSDTSETVWDRFHKWYPEQECPNVVFDLSSLEFMDSTGIGVLMAILKMVNEKSGLMKIASMQNKPSMLLSIIRAYRVLDIYDTVEAAFESFAEKTEETTVE